MGRLVEPGWRERVSVRRGGLGEANETVEVTVGGDGYKERIAKYIPGEVVAAYAALDRSLVPDATAHLSKLERLRVPVQADASTAKSLIALNPAADLMITNALPWVLLIIGVVFTPLYIRQLARDSGPSTPWATQAVISTIAFLIWAYAFQGSAFIVGPLGSVYHGSWAAALVAIFTLASGIFSPTPANSLRTPGHTL